MTGDPIDLQRTTKCMISRSPDTLEFWFFHEWCILKGQTKLVQRARDPSMINDWKMRKMNVHSKKWTSISLHLIDSSNELIHQLIPAKIMEIEQLQPEVLTQTFAHLLLSHPYIFLLDNRVLFVGKCHKFVLTCDMSVSQCWLVVSNFSLVKCCHMSKQTCDTSPQIRNAFQGISYICDYGLCNDNFVILSK